MYISITLFVHLLCVWQMITVTHASQSKEKCELVVNCTKKADNTSKSCHDFMNLLDKSCGYKTNYCHQYRNDLVKACTSGFCNQCLGNANIAYKDCLKFYHKLTISSSKAVAKCKEVRKTLNQKCPQVCHGVKGLSNDNPGKDCKDILDSSTSTVKNGLYWIQPDGETAPIQSYCDMSFAGGGWTLASYGYAATTTYGTQNTANKNIPNMNHPNGYTWNPGKRNSSQGVIGLKHGAVYLARGAKTMIMAAGHNPVTGGIDEYGFVYSIDISKNPYKITFANHNRYHGGVGTANIPKMHVIEFTVKALKGETGSGKRYALAEALGVSWSDTYPTGYGFTPVNANYGTWSKGPFFPSVHSGDRPAGGCQKPKSYAPDVDKGCPHYVHQGWHSLHSWKKTGQTSIWFK